MKILSFRGFPLTGSGFQSSACYFHGRHRAEQCQRERDYACRSLFHELPHSEIFKLIEKLVDGFLQSGLVEGHRVGSVPFGLIGHHARVPD